MMAEPFGTNFMDSAGDPITGGAANTEIWFLRQADGFYYDHDDSTFKASGWTTLKEAMTEVDATNDAGYYALSVDVSGWDDGRYQVRCRYDDGGTDIVNAARDFIMQDGVAW